MNTRDKTKLLLGLILVSVLSFLLLTLEWVTIVNTLITGLTGSVLMAAVLMVYTVGRLILLNQGDDDDDDEEY